MTNWFSEELVKQREQEKQELEQKRLEEEAAAFEAQMDSAGFEEYEKVRWREWVDTPYDEIRDWSINKYGAWQSLKQKFEAATGETIIASSGVPLMSYSPEELAQFTEWAEKQGGQTVTRAYIPAGFGYVRDGNNKYKRNAANNKMLRQASVDYFYDEDFEGDVGYPKDTSFLDTRDPDGKPIVRSHTFNTGIDFEDLTPAKLSFQGYSIPLTEAELLEGYQSILKTGDWMDPRFFLTRDLEGDGVGIFGSNKLADEPDTYFNIDGRISKDWETTNTNALSPKFANGSTKHNLAMSRWDTYYYQNDPDRIPDDPLKLEDNLSDNYTLAEWFLKEYTRGKAYSAYGPASTFEIFVGKDAENNAFSLYEMFDTRMPYVGNVTYMDTNNDGILNLDTTIAREQNEDGEWMFSNDFMISNDQRRHTTPLPPTHINGVHLELNEEDLGEIYTEVVLSQGFYAANQVMNSLPQVHRDVWKDREYVYMAHDKDDLILELSSVLSASDILSSGNEGILSMDSDNLRGLGDQFNSEHKKHLGLMADALDKYQEDPTEMTWAERARLHSLRLMQTPLLVQGSRNTDMPDMRDPAEGSGLDAVTEFLNYGMVIDSWDNRTTKYPYVYDSVDFQYRDSTHEVNWGTEEEPWMMPDTYGLTMLSFMGDNGDNFINGQLHRIDGTPVDRGAGDLSQSYYLGFTGGWTETVKRTNLPMFQETDTLGVSPEDRDRYYELKAQGKTNTQEFRNLKATLEASTLQIPAGALGGNPTSGNSSFNLWYDPTRLYMKHPAHVDIPGYDWSSIRFDGSYQITGNSLAWLNHVSPDTGKNTIFDEAFPDYSDFANPNKFNNNKGWFVDMSGGEAPVGSYSMVWVAQPPEPSTMDLFLSEPLIATMASLNPYTALAFAALQHQHGHTLHANDWVRVVTAGLKLGGKLKQPVPEESAKQMGENARNAAEAAADADGFVGQTIISMGEQAYQAAYLTAVADVGVGGLTYAQTMTVINAAAIKDEKEAIGFLLKGFGQEYFEKGLGSLGLDTSGLDPELMEDIYKVTTDVLQGKDFATAAAGPVGGRILDLFGNNNFKGAEEFFSGLTGDLKDALEAVGDVGEALGDTFKPFFDAAAEVDALTNFADTIYDVTSSFISSTNEVTQALQEKLKDIDEVVITPIKDTVLSGMSKFTNMIDLPEVSGTFTDEVEKFVDSLANASKNTWEGLDDSVKGAIEESVGLELLTGGDASVLERQNIFTKHLVTEEAIALIDSNVTDAIGVPLLTRAVRNAVGAAIGDGPAPGRVFLDTIANSTIAALKKLEADGDITQIQQAMVDFGTKISGAYGNVVDLTKELEDLEAKHASLITDRYAYETSLDDIEKQYRELRDAANAEDATQADVVAFSAFESQYSATVPDIVGAIGVLTDKINAIPDQYDAVEFDYGQAMANLAYETQQADHRLFLENDNLYIATLIELTKGELGLDFDITAYRGLYGLSPTKTSVEDVAKHFINNLSAGNPVTQEQYDAEYAAEATKFLTTIYTEMGVNVAKLDPETLQDFTRRILSKAIGTIGSDGSGDTALDALKGHNKSLEETGKLVISGGEAVASIENFFGREQSAGVLGEDGRPIAFDELKADESINNIGNYMNELIATAGDDWDKVLSGEIDFSISPTGELNWGADGHKQSMWSDSEQKFVTYQYNASGSERYKLNDNGTAPAESVRVYESTGMLTDLTTFIGPDPATYAAVLGNLEDEQALALEIDRLEREYPDSEELAGLKSLQTAVDNGYTPKEEEMPWGYRAAKMWLDGGVYIVDGLEEQIASYESKESLNPLDEIVLATLQEDLEKAKKGLEISANYVVGVPSLLNQWGESAMNGLTTFFKQLPAQSASNDQFVAAMKSGKTVAAASALADKVYNETTLATEDDWRSIVDNDAITLHKSVEALAHGYMTPEFLADETEMLANLNAAEGAVDNVKAVLGELYDKPNVFLAHVLGDELIPEVLTFGFGSVVGKSVARAATAEVGKELAERYGVKAALGTAGVLDAAEIFTDTSIGTYDLVLSELTRTGYEGDIDAKAQEIAVRAGLQGLLVAAATAPFGGAALDSKVLSKGAKEVLGTFAERIDDFATVVKKETLTEAIQEAYVAGFTEVALYNEGVTDRDATGEVAAAATMGALAGGSTTAIIAGFSAQPPLFSDSNTGPAGSGNVFSDMILANAQYQGMDKAQTREYLEAFGVLERIPRVKGTGVTTAPPTPALEVLYSGIEESNVQFTLSPNDAKMLAIELGRPISLNMAQEIYNAGNDRDAPWVANKSDEELSTYELKDVVNAFLEYTYGDAYIDTDGDGVKNNADLFPNDATETIDTDNDGVGDNADVYAEDARYSTEQQYQDAQDSDGDGVANAIDAFPNDGTETADSDNDGVGDNADAFPNDASETTDSDNDGVGDNLDVFPNDATETLDFDNDGVGDNADAFPNDASETTDSDNDGVGDNLDVFPNDATETLDFDNDGVGDNLDVFPNDATETLDFDNDGVGDTADTDDDNDGTLDALDAFPLNADEALDFDNDGVGDNADTDDDGDGTLDTEDAFPLDAAETTDSDNDGVGDNLDVFPEDATETLDTDNDGVGDNLDAFPLDAAETLDFDNDGVGDTADTDDDNDGTLDALDAFPLRADESVDTDQDGLGDNEDTDDDGDDVLDDLDAFPLDAAETTDSDSDSVGDNADPRPNDQFVYDDATLEAWNAQDLDEDGVINADDAFPENPDETGDGDGDGVGDNVDDDDLTRLGKYALVADINGDGTVDALTDGMLLLRHAFDLSGEELITGAITDESVRNTAKEIEEYLADERVQALLDVTNDGKVDALTDGLGLLRILFGLEGDGITKGLDLTPDQLADTMDKMLLATHSVFSLDSEGVPTEDIKTLPLPDTLKAPAGRDIAAEAELDELEAVNYKEAIPEIQDYRLDSDDDGTIDEFDAFPLDASETTDSDNDGVGDNLDVFPEDATETLDTDNDGVGDNLDVFPEDATETLDTDNDGVGDNADAFPNDASETLDTDNDGVGDNLDVFPDDATETLDTDNDGVGDNLDVFPNDATETLDTDNDGVGDNLDVFPNDATETLDTDNDGVGDNLDVFPEDATETLDTDNDGVGDNLDVFPEDATETLDTDNDGVGDNLDVFPEDASETLDTDNDGVGDNLDVFPDDATETLDTDNDGVGDNADAFPENPDETLDSDNDGVGDNLDVFPNDATETLDTDNDGVGDNLDVFPNDATETLDTDNDGVGDNLDVFPEDATETLDTDNDGVGDNLDVFPEDATETLDTDNDGVGDNLDAFPNDDTETVDSDNDGVGDNADPRPNNDTVYDDATLEAFRDNIEAEYDTLNEQTTAEIAGLQDAAEVTAEILGIEANLVTEEDIALVTEYLGTVELTQEKFDNILRYDVTGQDDLVTEEDLVLLTNAYTLGNYDGFDPDADFNPATGMYKTVAEKEAEIAAQNQAAIDAQVQYELDKQQALEQQQEESDAAKQDALTQLETDIRTEIETDINTAVESEIKTEAEEQEEKFRRQLVAPGRRGEITTPDPAIIQYEYDISGDSIFATPDQETGYMEQGPYAPRANEQSPYGGSLKSPYGASLTSKIQDRLQGQQGLASGGTVKDKTDEILRILGER